VRSHRVTNHSEAVRLFPGAFVVKTCVVISSLDRPEILHETVQSLQNQTIAPVTVILSLCDAASVLPETVQLPLVRVVLGGRGLTKQRNHGAQAAPAETRYVLFLDDDTELAPEYLERMEGLLDQYPEIVVASGVSAADGLRLGRALTRDQAKAAARKYPCESGTERAEGAYGCNMFVRKSILEKVRFDEGLLLEGWLEDYDFSVRCRQFGSVVWNRGTCVAHLGVQRLAREQGFPVGYSQIANPYYLWRKQVIPSFARLIFKFWFPALRVSIQGTLHGKPPWNVTFDYRGRLRGNVQALTDAARHKLAPSRIVAFTKDGQGVANGT
jgi:glycosyltransferase involved in cell wall biosynthesis